MIELCWCNAFIHFISFVTTGCQSGKLLLRSQVAPKPEKIDISANQARNQTGEKLSSVVLFVTNYFNIQGILKYTWELTPERNPSNVQYAKSHLPRQQLLKIITKHTLEKNHLHVLCALKHSLGQDIWSRIQELTLERNQTIVPFAKSHFPRQQFLEIITKHTEEKPFS